MFKRFVCYCSVNICCHQQRHVVDKFLCQKGHCRTKFLWKDNCLLVILKITLVNGSVIVTPYAFEKQPSHLQKHGHEDNWYVCSSNCNKFSNQLFQFEGHNFFVPQRVLWSSIVHVYVLVLGMTLNSSLLSTAWPLICSHVCTCRSEVHINNWTEISEVHGPRLSALLALTGGPWWSTENRLAVRILDRGPHFEYPWCRWCFVRWKAPGREGSKVSLLSWHGSHFWACITFCTVWPCKKAIVLTKPDYFYSQCFDL